MRVVLEYGLMVHRDQAEREAKYGKQCMPHIGYAELILTHIPISAQSHGRSVTALAGEKKINAFSRWHISNFIQLTKDRVGARIVGTRK